MKTFLKILLVLLLLFVAIKLSPLIFSVVLFGLIGAAIVGVFGLSLMAVFVAIVAALAAVSAPIWIPILLIVGVVALFKKIGERPAWPTAVR